MKKQAAPVINCCKTSLHTTQTGTQKRFRWLCITAALALVLIGKVPRASATGQVSVTPGTVSFGSLAVGKTTAVTLTVKNTGNATVTLTGDALTGSGFKLSGITVPKYINAGAAATFSVIFAPVNTVAYAGKITLISNASNSTVAIALAGTGITNTAASYISATPLTATFGNVPVGTRNTQTIVLKNTGSKALTISSIAAKGTGFSVSGITLPHTLAAAGTAYVTVAFLPSTTGAVSGSVTIGSTGLDSALLLAVSGTGVTATRVLSATPGSVSFGNVNVNTTKEVQVYLKNSGNSTLSVSGHAVGGAGLSVAASTGVTLAPGQGMTLRAYFAPKVAGSVAGSVTIASNATNATSLKVPLTGTGIAASATTTHKVTLLWNASSSSGVAGYYVYRSTASAGPFKEVSGMVSGTSYTDTNVNAGATYYYTVTAMGSDGEESSYSNHVTATIP